MLKTLILSAALVGSVFAATLAPAQAAYSYRYGYTPESHLGGYGQTGRNYPYQGDFEHQGE